MIVYIFRSDAPPRVSIVESAKLAALFTARSRALSTLSLAAPRVPGTPQGLMLLLPCTLSVMGIVVLLPVLPQIMEHYNDVPNYRYLIQGGVLTMPALCIMLFSPLAGWLADRFGRRNMLIASMIVYAFVGIAPIFLENLYAIIATRVAVGLCEAVVMTVSTTMISDYFKGLAREKWLASQTAVASVSSLFLIFTGGVLGSLYGWRGPFAVYLFGLLLAFGIWRLTWEPQSESHGGSPENADSSFADLNIVYFEFPWSRIAGICAITLFASVMFYVVQTQNSLALNVLGITDPKQLGTLTALASLGVPIGTFIFRGLMRMPPGVLLFIEFALIGGTYIGMGKAPHYEEFVAVAFFNQIGCGMILPTLLTWATRGLAFDIRGRGNGVWTGVFAVGQFLSGITVTYLGDQLGGLLPAMVALGFSSLAAAALAIVGYLIYRSMPGATSRPMTS